MMITVKNLVKTYGTGSLKHTVLHGVNLDVPTGEFLAIMGPSGAGKSTLLYQMGLLDHPTSGDVVLDGTDTRTLSKSERTRFRLEKLGYVFQDYALLPDLTAIENVAVPLLMQGFAKSNAFEISTKYLGQVGLGEQCNKLPNQLSGGEQQRVSIARAIAHKPKIVFADELTANLDSVTSKKVLGHVLQLARAGQTIVMVTHEHTYAKLADRIIHIRDGNIERDILTRKKKR
jgi:putative ABC transport system ATP-binding protein